MSAYIPTNVISITDGQIFLESDLFYSGVRPAINVGISVSRVGGNAQTKAMKKVAGRLRLDLAQYRNLEAFAQFGSELDDVTRRTLALGERMVASLNQPQYTPWPFEEQVVAIFAGIHGHLADVPTAQVPRFQDELREYLRTEGTVYAGDPRDCGDLPDSLQERLVRADQRSSRTRSTCRRRRVSWERARLGARDGLASKTSSAGSGRSGTRARSPRRWSSSRALACVGRRRASRRCARTPSGCAS